MRTRRRATIDHLRQAINCLPRHTRIAMLEDEDAPGQALAAARREHEALLARIDRRHDDYAIIIRRLEHARTEAERGEPALPT
jgi:hypothetical protein